MSSQSVSARASYLIMGYSLSLAFRRGSCTFGNWRTRHAPDLERHERDRVLKWESLESLVSLARRARSTASVKVLRLPRIAVNPDAEQLPRQRRPDPRPQPSLPNRRPPLDPVGA